MHFFLLFFFFLSLISGVEIGFNRGNAVTASYLPHVQVSRIAPKVVSLVACRAHAYGMLGGVESVVAGVCVGGGGAGGGGWGDGSCAAVAWPD